MLDPGTKLLVFVSGGGGVIGLVWWLFSRLTRAITDDPTGPRDDAPGSDFTPSDVEGHDGHD